MDEFYRECSNSFSRVHRVRQQSVFETISSCQFVFHANEFWQCYLVKRRLKWNFWLRVDIWLFPGYWLIGTTTYIDQYGLGCASLGATTCIDYRAGRLGWLSFFFFFPPYAGVIASDYRDNINSVSQCRAREAIKSTRLVKEVIFKFRNLFFKRDIYICICFSVPNFTRKNWICESSIF